MVLDYLVHYGYCNTAQLFATATGQQIEEEVASIRNRQSKKCHLYHAQLLDNLKYITIPLGDVELY